MANLTERSDSSDFMKEHLRTWHGFLKFVKWMVIGSVILLLVLLIWRTNG